MKVAEQLAVTWVCHTKPFHGSMTDMTNFQNVRSRGNFEPVVLKMVSSVPGQEEKYSDCVLFVSNR